MIDIELEWSRVLRYSQESPHALLQEQAEGFLYLLVEVGRGAVEDAGGFAGAVEEEHGGHGSDVTETLRGGRVGDGPVQIGAQRCDGGADLIFGRFDGKREDGDVVAVLAFEFAEPFKRGAAGRAPGGPELNENDAIGELVRGQRVAGKIGELDCGKRSEFAGGTGFGRVLAADDIFFAGED